MGKRVGKFNNKGFTLVELIIVMAIMAILAGALAPQVMKYVERSRESRDLQLVNTVFTAVSTAIATYDGNGVIPENGSLDDYTAVIHDLPHLLNQNMDTDAEILARCVSKIGNGDDVEVAITYNDDTDEVSVGITSDAGVIGPVTN